MWIVLLKHVCMWDPPPPRPKAYKMRLRFKSKCQVKGDWDHMQLHAGFSVFTRTFWTAGICPLVGYRKNDQNGFLMNTLPAPTPTHVRFTAALTVAQTCYVPRHRLWWKSLLGKDQEIFILTCPFIRWHHQCTWIKAGGFTGMPRPLKSFDLLACASFRSRDWARYLLRTFFLFFFQHGGQTFVTATVSV